MVPEKSGRLLWPILASLFPLSLSEPSLNESGILLLSGSSRDLYNNNRSSSSRNLSVETAEEEEENGNSLDTLLLVLKSGILILIITLAILNNLLVVLSVVRYHRLRHINNYFLVSLAAADLLVACFAMTFNALVEITGEWNFGPLVCDLWNSLDVHFSTVSTLHLCCISVDRYFAIVKPLKYKSYMTVRVAAVMIGVAWISPTLISFLPIFLGWYTTPEHLKWREANPEECIFKVNQAYAFISSGLTFWVPVAIMLCMYHRIYKEALRQKESIRRCSVPSQQHLIVDSDKGRTRINELQANGLKSSVDPSSGSLNMYEINPSGSSSSSNNAPYSRAPPSRLGVPSSASSYRLSSSNEEENIPLNNGGFREKETRFGGLNNNNNNINNNFSVTLSRCTSPSPSRNCSLTPPASNNLLSVINAKARRVSMAQSINSDGLRERQRSYSSWRKEHKAFVTLGIVMGAFLLCWLPFFTWYLTTAICGDEQCPCPRVVVTILFWIGYFNSTLNPVIYVMTNRDFKDAFSDILRKTFCWICSTARRGPDHAQKEWAGIHTHSNIDYV